jgi:hypothetical protein
MHKFLEDSCTAPPPAHAAGRLPPAVTSDPRPSIGQSAPPLGSIGSIAVIEDTETLSEPPCRSSVCPQHAHCSTRVPAPAFPCTTLRACAMHAHAALTWVASCARAQVLDAGEREFLASDMAGMEAALRFLELDLVSLMERARDDLYELDFWRCATEPQIRSSPKI